MAEQRRAWLAVAGGAAVATGSLALAGLAGPPYLSLDTVNAGIVGFAVGLFAALFATPFVLETRLRARQPDRDARWERAMLAWGGLALALGALGVVVGLAGDFASDSLWGTAGLVVAVESSLVVATLLGWLVTG